MPLIVADRVLETCAAPGTGTVTLLGAEVGYQAFSVAVGNANTTYYTIADQSGANWEVGIGTYSLGGNTLARTTVLASSNSGSLVNFSSGVQNVFVTYPAEKSVNYDASNNLTLTGTTNIANLNVSTTMTLNGAAGTSGQVLTSAGSGSLPTWQTPSSSVTTATNLAGGAAGSVPYQSASGTTTFLAAGTNGQVLTLSGGVPTWATNGAGTVTSVDVSGGTTGLTTSGGPITASGTITLAGTLATTNGGTGLTTVGTNGQVLTSNGTTLSWVTPAPTTSITNDTTTNTTEYPLFASATSGSAATVYTSSPNYTFNPSTGQLSALNVASSAGIFLNSNVIAANYTIPANNNGMSAGPITINDGITVTIPAGSNWSVV